MKLNMVESNNIYKFKDLAKALYDTFRINKNELVQDMFENIVFEDKILLVKKSSDSYYGYFRGNDISSLACKILTFIDKDRFGAWLSELLLSENSNELLYTNMINNGFSGITIDNIVDDVTQIFVNIIENAGIQKNSIDFVDKLNIDEIRVEEVLDNPIKDINNEFAARLSKKITGGSRIGDSLLRETYGDNVSKYYKLKPKIIGENLKYYIAPRSDEAFNKLPITTNLKFDIENCTEEEKYNITHFKEVLDNLDYNNKPIALPPILEEKKTIDSKIIPNDLFEFDERQGKLYILPNKDIAKYKFSFKVFNKDMSVEINDLELVAIHKHSCTIFTNNNRNKKERYILDIIADNITKESMDLRYEIRLKPEYAEDLSAILEYYKIKRLLDDELASLRIINNDNNLLLISNDKVGKVNYTETQRAAIKRFVSDFEKLIYIENYYNVKFKFNIDYMQKKLNVIEIVYASITQENAFIYFPGTELNFKYFDEDTINMRPGDKIFFENKIDNINLFGENLKLNNTIIRTSEAIIKNIDKKTKEITISSDCIEITIDESKISE